MKRLLLLLLLYPICIGDQFINDRSYSVMSMKVIFFVSHEWYTYGLFAKVTLLLHSISGKMESSLQSYDTLTEHLIFIPISISETPYFKNAKVYLSKLYAYVSTINNFCLTAKWYTLMIGYLFLSKKWINGTHYDAIQLLLQIFVLQ